MFIYNWRFLFITGDWGAWHRQARPGEGAYLVAETQDLLRWDSCGEVLDLVSHGHAQVREVILVRDLCPVRQLFVEPHFHLWKEQFSGVRGVLGQSI